MVLDGCCPSQKQKSSLLPQLWQTAKGGNVMKLSTKQGKFTRMVALLILHAEQKGYMLTFGDVYRDKRCPYGHDKSLHKSRLAADFNLFDNGVYLAGEEAETAHGELHDYWGMIGGADRIEHDLNHYSLAHEGMR